MVAVPSRFFHHILELVPEPPRNKIKSTPSFSGRSEKLTSNGHLQCPIVKAHAQLKGHGTWYSIFYNIVAGITKYLYWSMCREGSPCWQHLAVTDICEWAWSYQNDQEHEDLRQTPMCNLQGFQFLCLVPHTFLLISTSLFQRKTPSAII